MSKYREMARQAHKKNAGVTRDLKSASSIYSTYYDPPSEISIWYAKGSEKGEEYYIDILQFPFGKNFPNEQWSPPWGEGDFPPTLIVDVHKDVGPEGAWVICPKANYLERCPICEELDARQKAIYTDESLTKEEQKAKAKKVWEKLRTYRRQLLYIVVRDGDEEEKKGVQLWEVPTAYMHDILDVIRKQSRTGDVIPYDDYDYGKTVKFTVKKKGDQYAEFLGHQFEDRTDPSTKKAYTIEDEFIDFVCEHPLGAMLKRMTYDEVCAVYYAKKAGGEEAEKEEAAPATSRASRRRNAAQEEAPPDEPAEETPPPATRSRRRNTEPAEEAPPANKCPEGGVFGKDCLKLPDKKCERCSEEIFALCDEEGAKLEAAAKEAPPARKRRNA